MSDVGIVVALIGLVSAVLTALIAVWRFYRKDRADAEAVEEGTISGRFKDADTLMQYIDQRVDERTEVLTAQMAGVSAKLASVEGQFSDLKEAVRAVTSQQWRWEHRGRPGPLPMLPPPILSLLGIEHLSDDWPTEPTH